MFLVKEADLVIRSLLFAPANEARKVNRLSDSGADAVVLDLEDAVANDQKVAARADARSALSRISGPLRCIRVNPFGTGLTEGDIAAIVTPDLDAIVFPKVEDPRELEIADRLIAVAEVAAGAIEHSVLLIALVETARGIAEATRIVQGCTRRPLRLAIGTGDLGVDLHLPRFGNLNDALSFGRGKFVYDLRSVGLPGPIDGPCLAVRDHKALEEECLASASLGYTGKVCIHPEQVPVVNRIFSPDPAEVAYAREILTAFNAAEAKGSAAIEVRGVFIDYPIVYKARHIVAFADRIAAHEIRSKETKHD